MRFLIDWLLCTTAFAIIHVPPDQAAILRAVVAGVLVAIAIGIVGPEFGAVLKW